MLRMRQWGVVLLLTATPVLAQEARFYEQDGQTWRESRRTVSRPIREVDYAPQSETVYETRYRTEMQSFSRPVYVPTTQYQWVPRWHGRWRIFQGPHLAYHLVPQTVWSVQRNDYQLPTTRVESVPITRTVQVPRTELKFVEKEEVTRVPVGPPRTIASRPVTDEYSSGAIYGGVARLEGDPPRRGPVFSSDGWRARR